MPYKLNRPAADFDSTGGLAVLEHFQMAYVTNDIERACDLFRRNLGVREFCKLEGPTPAGGYIHAEFAWVGTLMYEIIHATGPGSEFFMDRLPGCDEFALAHHHLGFLVQNQQQWDGVLRNAEAQAFPVLQRNVNPLVEVCFVAVPGMAHYLEYLYATPVGMEFFENVPRT
jgi:hypothetical protein